MFLFHVLVIKRQHMLVLFHPCPPGIQPDCLLKEGGDPRSSGPRSNILFHEISSTYICYECAVNEKARKDFRKFIKTTKKPTKRKEDSVTYSLLRKQGSSAKQI
ncbi:hypothetical protein MHBO_004479 [Bonamia ostreae]|uniref:Uncharacterized protein n=1 Tax=Bonamia ostreae TaxID=126728 RepID=A0ABV2ATE6_9EUKA